MGLGDLLGQVMQNGLGQDSQTRNRIGAAGNNLSGNKGIEGIFGQLQAALGQATGGATQGGGGFREKATDFLKKDQMGGLSGAQIGGIGAAAGALLGGGLGGAARGGAMAVLGTLALGALKRAQAGQQAQTGDAEITVDHEEIRALTGPDSERLALRAMISAAKADGRIDQAEMQKIVGRLGSDHVTPEEKQFVLDELSAPMDVARLVADVRSQAQAAEVYAASILAIHADTPEEQRYLAELASALRLDDATVAELHRLTDAPTT